MSDAAVNLVKLAISLAAALYLTARALGLRRRRAGRGEGTGPAPPAARAILAVLALASMLAYFNFGWFHRQYLSYGWLSPKAYLHQWELYHYYLGSKYFAEVGYRDLYGATLVADEEGGGNLSAVTRVRDLGDYSYVKREKVLARSAYYRGLFSTGRWDRFKTDVAHFTRILPPSVSAAVLLDHGYNPSPVWNAVGETLSNLVPVQKIGWLAALDPLLLLAMFTGVLLAFGTEAALAAAILFGVNFYAPFSWTGGSFLRWDWLACTVLSLCLVHRRRYASAGALLACAATVRIFPALFLAGPGIKAARHFVRHRRVPARYVRFFAAFGLAAALLFGGSWMAGERGAVWREFARRMSVHNATFSSNKVGFRAVFLHDASVGDEIEFRSAYRSDKESPEAVYQRAKAAEYARRRGMFWLYALAMVSPVLVIAAGKPDGESFLWGMVPIFLWLNLSNYYWAFLVMPAFVWCRRPRVPRRMLFAAALFLGQALGLVAVMRETFPIRLWALASLILFSGILVLILAESIPVILRLAGRRASSGRRGEAA